MDLEVFAEGKEDVECKLIVVGRYARTNPGQPSPRVQQKGSIGDDLWNSLKEKILGMARKQ
jgi:hypothetical protein